MNRLVFIAASAIAILPALPADAGERIEVIEHALTDATLDLGAKGNSVVDLLTFDPIYDATNKMQLGTVRVIAGKSWECFWTWC
jgi:hypothetical protein